MKWVLVLYFVTATGGFSTVDVGDYKTEFLCKQDLGSQMEKLQASFSKRAEIKGHEVAAVHVFGECIGPLKYTMEEEVYCRNVR